MISKSNALRILEKGILAPSADNLQPWIFQFYEDGIDFYIDPARVNNFCDTGLLTPYISAGAVIENMRVAACEAGAGLDVQYMPDGREPFWVARIGIKPQIAVIHDHAAALNRRVTNRKMYRSGKKIREETYQKLLQQGRSEQGFDLLFVTAGDARYRELRRIIGDSDQIRFETRRLHRELMRTLRFCPKEAVATKDGLDVRTMEAGPGSGLFFKFISDWNRLAGMNCIGLSRMFNFYARAQMASSQSAGLIVAPSRSRCDFVRGGEVMQRVWHAATLEGLAIQPMEALPIFILNLQLGHDEDFSRGQRERLEKLRADFFRLFGINDEKGLILLFRMGYADSPGAHSLRRPLHEFIESRNSNDEES